MDNLTVSEGSNSMDGKFDGLIFSRSSATVIASFGLESSTCFESSKTVYTGLQVVTMAPIAATARKQTR